jgi:hypothetical protein
MEKWLSQQIKIPVWEQNYKTLFFFISMWISVTFLLQVDHIMIWSQGQHSKDYLQWFVLRTAREENPVWFKLIEMVQLHIHLNVSFVYIKFLGTHQYFCIKIHVVSGAKLILAQNALCLNWNSHIQPELRSRALILWNVAYEDGA